MCEPDPDLAFPSEGQGSSHLSRDRACEIIRAGLVDFDDAAQQC